MTAPAPATPSERLGDRHIRADAGLTDHLVTGLLAASITLIQLPILVGHQAVVTPAVLAVLLLGIAWALPRRGVIERHQLLLPLALFVVLVDVAIWRGMSAGVYGHRTHAAALIGIYAVLPTLALTAIAASRDTVERRQRIVAVLVAPALYATINAVLYIAHVHAAAAPTEAIATLQPASTLAWFGIHINRVQFPLASGVNNTGVIAGAGLAACLILRHYHLASRRMLAALTAGCLFCLLWGDSRIALAMGIGVALYFGWSRDLLGARWIAALIPAMPFLMIFGSRLLSSGGVAASLSRNQGDASSVGSRLPIWDAAWHWQLSHLSLDQLVGWGTNGQVTSGVSLHYAYIFAYLPNPTGYSTHSVVIQTILETGYVGLCALVALSFVTLASLGTQVRRNRLAAAMAAAAVVLLLGGATEAVPTSGSQEITGMLLMICAATAALGEGVSPTAVTSPQSATRSRPLHRPHPR